MRMLLEEEQRAVLMSFLNDIAGWNAMVMFKRPGDVVALHPIAPQLRGIEIVAALDDNEIDIWKNGNPFKMGLTPAQAAEYISTNSPSEEDFIEHGAEWSMALLISLGVPERSTKN